MDKQLTIGQLLGLTSPRADFRYGMELEMEGGERFDSDMLRENVGTRWDLTVDHSLRGGVELVSNALSVGHLSAAIRRAYDFVIPRGYGHSPRTGIHLHVNQQTRTLEEVLAFIAAYTLYEPMLLQRVGGDRWENVYCIPLCELGGSARRLRAEWDREHKPTPTGRWRRSVLQYMVRPWAKYTALNVLPLHDIGTVELRMPPFWEDVEHTLEFLQSVHEIQQFAEGKSPEDVLRIWGTNEAENIEALEEISGTALAWCNEDRLVADLDLYDPAGVVERLCAPAQANSEWGPPNRRASGTNGFRYGTIGTGSRPVVRTTREVA